MGITSKRPRIIAIGRSVNGQPFQVIAPPADFAEAVAVADSRQAQDVRLSDMALTEIENEKIGEEFSRTPFLY